MADATDINSKMTYNPQDSAPAVSAVEAVYTPEDASAADQNQIQAQKALFLKQRLENDRRNGNTADWIMLNSYYMHADGLVSRPFMHASDEEAAILVDETGQVRNDRPVGMLMPAAMTAGAGATATLASMNAGAAQQIQQAQQNNPALSVNAVDLDVTKKGDEALYQKWKQSGASDGTHVTGIDGKAFAFDASIFAGELSEDELVNNASFQEAAKMIFEAQEGKSWSQHINEKLESRSWIKQLDGALNPEDRERIKQALIAEEAGEYGVEIAADFDQRLDKILFDDPDKYSPDQKIAMEYMREAFQHKSIEWGGGLKGLRRGIWNSMATDKVNWAVTALSVALAIPTGGASLAVGAAAMAGRTAVGQLVKTTATKAASTGAGKIITGGATQATSLASSVTIKPAAALLNKTSAGQAFTTAMGSNVAKAAAIDSAVFEAPLGAITGAADFGNSKDINALMIARGFDIQSMENANYGFWAGARDAGLQGLIGYGSGRVLGAGGDIISTSWKSRGAAQNPATPNTTPNPNNGPTTAASGGRTAAAQAIEQKYNNARTYLDSDQLFTAYDNALTAKANEVQTKIKTDIDQIVDDIVQTHGLDAEAENAVRSAVDASLNGFDVDSSITNAVAPKVTAAKKLLDKGNETLTKADEEIQKVDGRGLVKGLSNTKNDADKNKIRREAVAKLEQDLGTNEIKLRRAVVDMNRALRDDFDHIVDHARDEAKKAGEAAGLKNTADRALEVQARQQSVSDALAQAGSFMPRRDRVDLVNDVLGPSAAQNSVADLKQSLHQFNKDFRTFLKDNPDALENNALIDTEIANFVQKQNSLSPEQQDDLADALEEQAENYINQLNLSVAGQQPNPQAAASGGQPQQQTQTQGSPQQQTQTQGSPQQPQQQTQTQGSPQQQTQTQGSPQQQTQTQGSPQQQTQTQGSQQQGQQSRQNPFGGGSGGSNNAGNRTPQGHKIYSANDTSLPDTFMPKDKSDWFSEFMGWVQFASPHSYSLFRRGIKNLIPNDIHIPLKIRPILKEIDTTLHQNKLTDKVMDLQTDIHEVTKKIANKTYSKAEGQTELKKLLTQFQQDVNANGHLDAFNRDMNSIHEQVGAERVYNTFGEMLAGDGTDVQNTVKGPKTGINGFTPSQRNSAMFMVEDIQERINHLANPQSFDALFNDNNDPSVLSDLLNREINHIADEIDQAQLRYTTIATGNTGKLHKVTGTNMTYYDMGVWTLPNQMKGAGTAKMLQAERKITRSAYIKQTKRVIAKGDTLENSEADLFGEVASFAENNKDANGKVQFNSQSAGAFAQILERAIDSGHPEMVMQSMIQLVRKRGPMRTEEFPQDFIDVLRNRKPDDPFWQELCDRIDVILRSGHNDGKLEQRDVWKAYQGFTQRMLGWRGYTGSRRDDLDPVSNWLSGRMSAIGVNDLWRFPIKEGELWFHKPVAYLFHQKLEPNEQGRMRLKSFSWVKENEAGEKNWKNHVLIRAPINLATAPVYLPYRAGKAVFNFDPMGLGLSPIKSTAIAGAGIAVAGTAGGLIVEGVAGEDAPDLWWVPKGAWNVAVGTVDYTIGTGIRLGADATTWASEKVGLNGYLHSGWLWGVPDGANPGNILRGDNFLGMKDPPIFDNGLYFDLGKKSDSTLGDQFDGAQKGGGTPSSTAAALAAAAATQGGGTPSTTPETEGEGDEAEAGKGMSVSKIKDTASNAAGSAFYGGLNFLENQVTQGRSQNSVSNAFKDNSGFVGKIKGWWGSADDGAKWWMKTIGAVLGFFLGYGLLKNEKPGFGSKIGNILKFFGVATAALMIWNKSTTGKFIPGSKSKSKPLVAQDTSDKDDSTKTNAPKEAKEQVSSVISKDDPVYAAVDKDDTVEAPIAGQSPKAQHASLRTVSTMVGGNMIGISDKNDQIHVKGITDPTQIRMPENIEIVGADNVAVLHPVLAANEPPPSAPERHLDVG